MVERVREVVIERHGDLKLKVGGKHGYVRVRGGQGSTKDQYQGYTVDKKHFTAGYTTAREAAIALAETGVGARPRRWTRQGNEEEAQNSRRCVPLCLPPICCPFLNCYLHAVC